MTELSNDQKRLVFPEDCDFQNIHPSSDVTNSASLGRGHLYIWPMTDEVQGKSSCCVYENYFAILCACASVREMTEVC